MSKFSEIVKQNLCTEERISERSKQLCKTEPAQTHGPPHQWASLQHAQRPRQLSPQRLRPPLQGYLKVSFSPEARSPLSSHQLLIDELASKQNGDAVKSEILQYSAQQSCLPLCPLTPPSLLSPFVQGKLLHLGSGSHPFLFSKNCPLLQMCTTGF